MLIAFILTAEGPNLEQRPIGREEEIVVTGERIARSVHETASSVVVETASSIEALAVPLRIEQILQGVPNVQLGSGGEGPTIRGLDSTGVVRDLPAFLAGTRPRMTISIDGRAASYYELAFGTASIWDAARVEVFRSPQSTTQGRNSIGGAIFMETGAPTFDWRGKARAIAGNYDARQISGMISGPLLQDQLAVRLSGDLQRNRGSSFITDPVQGVNPNDVKSEVIRFKLLARPVRIPGAELDLSYWHGRSQEPQFQGIEPPYRQRRNPNATYGIFAISVDSLTARASYRPADGRCSPSAPMAQI
jgi:iron complex outermembrane receptor protein